LHFLYRSACQLVAEGQTASIVDQKTAFYRLVESA
jgi:hypothetical protein